MADETEIFFYTIEYPHRWTSGPIILTTEDDYSYIKSLERAKELAEEKKVGGSSEETITTTYGSYFETRRNR